MRQSSKDIQMSVILTTHVNVGTCTFCCSKILQMQTWWQLQLVLWPQLTLLVSNRSGSPRSPRLRDSLAIDHLSIILSWQGSPQKASKEFRPVPELQNSRDRPLGCERAGPMLRAARGEGREQRLPWLLGLGVAHGEKLSLCLVQFRSEMLKIQQFLRDYFR